MADAEQPNLVVDEEKNVFVVFQKDVAPEHIGTLKYEGGRFWFVPMPKVVNGRMGLLGFDITMLENITKIVKDVSKTPSDEEMDDLFNQGEV